MAFFDYVTCEPLRIWDRLEPRARRVEFDEALQARVHDPLWMLGRQWQMGEFKGEDAGSAVLAKLARRLTPVAEVTVGRRLARGRGSLAARRGARRAPADRLPGHRPRAGSGAASPRCSTRRPPPSRRRRRGSVRRRAPTARSCARASAIDPPAPRRRTIPSRSRARASTRRRAAHGCRARRPRRRRRRSSTPPSSPG